jgi:hypothetical protein
VRLTCVVTGLDDTGVSEDWRTRMSLNRMRLINAEENQIELLLVKGEYAKRFQSEPENEERRESLAQGV